MLCCQCCVANVVLLPRAARACPPAASPCLLPAHCTLLTPHPHSAFSRTPCPCRSRIQQLKLLSKLEQSGLLSLLERQGLTLSKLEQSGALSAAERLGVVSLLGDRNFPGTLYTLAAALLAAGPAAVYFLPDDSTGLGERGCALPSCCGSRGTVQSKCGPLSAACVHPPPPPLALCHQQALIPALCRRRCCRAPSARCCSGAAGGGSAGVRRRRQRGLGRRIPPVQPPEVLRGIVGLELFCLLLR